MIYNYKFIKKYLDKKPGVIRILNKTNFCKTSLRSLGSIRKPLTKRYLVQTSNIPKELSMLFINIQYFMIMYKKYERYI